MPYPINTYPKGTYVMDSIYFFLGTIILIVLMFAARRSLGS